MTSYRVDMNTIKYFTGGSIINDRINISRPIAFCPTLKTRHQRKVE